MLNVVFGLFIYVVFESMVGDDLVIIKVMMLEMFDQVGGSFVDIVVFIVIQFLVEVQMNYDMFRECEIEYMGDWCLFVEVWYDDRMNLVSVVLGQCLWMSFKKIDYVVESYFGYWLGFVVWVVSQVVELVVDILLKQKIVKDVFGLGVFLVNELIGFNLSLVYQFYEQWEEINQV